MSELLQQIQSRLNASPLADSLTPLFCETLRWGAPRNLAPRSLAVGAPLSRTLTATPVAQLTGLPVFRVDWPEDRPPTVTARRAVHRALAPIHAEHLLCYLTRDRRQASFVWARKRADGKTQLRTLPYEVGAAARTTIERLGELAFSLDELGPTGQPSITALTDKLNAAFSVEAVTRQFYNEIANWYFWAQDCRDIALPKDVRTDEDRALFLIRLLTRLIFCWFLRKKRNSQTNESLLPDDFFDERAIRQLLKDSSPEACTYYPAILQNLFFATLNTEMDKLGESPNRRFVDEGDGQRSDDHMIHTVWRNARLLRDPEVFASLLRRVPFLNGGLFECLDDRVQKGNSAFTEEVRIDGFSNDPRKKPKLPNFLFFGADQVVDLSGAYGDSKRRRETVRPLLSILSGYNFTLTENTPLEQEVALDPELLGHVFENLLAAYNPETGIVARNATGSFYTPRVVVDWMVDQALLVYLGKALARAGSKTSVAASSPSPPSGERGGVRGQPDAEARLRQLLSWEDTQPEFSRAETEALIDAIDHLKALDPACGSGAFPMGLLQKLVHVLRKLDPENKGWRRRQEAALDSFDSATAREEARKAVERAFARDNDDYGRKLYLIENCLYGVDIQPIACQIAKLRFFIALICDQSIDPAEPNYGILPLPNLETKIVAANTLLGLQRGQLLLGSDRVRQLEKQLQQVRHDYFTARRYKDKKTLRARDKELCAQLATALTQSGECSPYDAKRLAEWNPYDTNTDAPFFDPAWMFGLPVSNDHDKGVFDIVIGNPPYVRQEQLRNVTVTASDGQPRPLKDALKDLYECYTGTADLYVYFFERSLQLLRLGGMLSFITSNKYMRAAYGERLRTCLFYATHPRAILDFGDAPVFTSIAYPCILVTEKTRALQKGGLPNPEQFAIPERIKQLLDAPERTVRVHTWNPGGALLDFPDIFDGQANSIAQRDLKPDGWRLESPVSLRLLERLRKAGKPLREYVGSRVYRGITTGLNEAFVVDHVTRDLLIEEHKSSAEVLKPFCRGRDVERWQLAPQDQWLIFTRRGCDIRRFPAIHEHLKQFKKQLTPGTSGGRKPGSYEWFEIQDNIAYFEEFEKPKVVSTKVSIRPTFALDRQGCYLGNTSYFIPAGDTGLYVLALLNSNLYEGYARRVFVEKQGGWYEVQPDGLEAFPVPEATPDQQRQCKRLAEALIWLHGPGAVRRTGDAPLGLMKAYFEQWLNGLVYELFFPGDLHARKLKLFAETARLAPPDLSAVPEPQKLARLQELFAKAHDGNAPLRAMLFDLPSLEVVHIIEQAGGQSRAAETSMEETTKKQWPKE
jgi:hypothetical protein